MFSLSFFISVCIFSDSFASSMQDDGIKYTAKLTKIINAYAINFFRFILILYFLTTSKYWSSSSSSLLKVPNIVLSLYFPLFSNSIYVTSFSCNPSLSPHTAASFKLGLCSIVFIIIKTFKIIQKADNFCLRKITGFIWLIMLIIRAPILPQKFISIKSCKNF